MKPGDVAIIFTPDDTHVSLAAAAITAGLHVLVAKPLVKTLAEHKQLVALAKKHNVLVRAARRQRRHSRRACAAGEEMRTTLSSSSSCRWLGAVTPRVLVLLCCCLRHAAPHCQLAVEYHKRFDPVYSDARIRARSLGPFSYYYSYMAQVRAGTACPHGAAASTCC